MSTIYTNPGAQFESKLTNAPSGLVGTLHVQIIRDSDGSVVLARTTAGIVESPAASGRYVFTHAAPTLEDQYTVLWDRGSVTPENTAEDTLLVNSDLVSLIEGESPTILSVADYKTLRNIPPGDTTRDASLALAAKSATDAILQYTDRNFLDAEVEEARTFTYNYSGILEIDDCTEVVSVTHNGATLAEGNDYIAEPDRGPGQTFYWLDLSGVIGPSPEMGFKQNLDVLARRAYPQGRRTVTRIVVTAKWGWPAGGPPASVTLAAAWLMDDAAPATDPASTGHQAEAIADLSYVNSSPEQKSEPTTLPPRVLALLEPFRRIGV